MKPVFGIQQPPDQIKTLVFFDKSMVGESLDFFCSKVIILEIENHFQ